MDFTDDFENEPTKDQLEARAAAYLRNNTPWVPKENLTVDFVALWQTEEYKNIAPLERVGLCDTVRIIYTALGVDAKAKVIKVVWDALTERYSSIELGEAKSSFADTIMQSTEKVMEDRPTYSVMAEAIDKASELIRGGSGGHVVIGADADGKPNEIFIMDTEDVNTAVNVLRINMNGIGFSSNGVEGEYSTAWTLDGSFVADFITAGTMAENRIRTGTLESSDGSSYWDLDGSVLRFYDQRFDSFVELDEGFIRFCHDEVQFGKILRMLSGGDDILVITGPDNNTRFAIRDYISLTAKDSISQNAGGYIYQKAGTYIYQKSENNIRLYTGESDTSKIRMYDDGTSQYIDMNSGGDTWERIDGDNAYITLAAGHEEGGTGVSWIRVDGDTGYVWIKTADLIINGFRGYTGSFTAGDSTVTVKNGIITNVS